MENENIDESDSESPSYEVPACVPITCARFASVFHSFFLSLIFGQSTFQCPNSLQKGTGFSSDF